uniref:Uncharacterized protein n=1 Tax=Macaca fascicularis TaxID=9541 RepID=A0A7N9C987_MACFA
MECSVWKKYCCMRLHTQPGTAQALPGTVSVWEAMKRAQISPRVTRVSVWEEIDDSIHLSPGTLS